MTTLQNEDISQLSDAKRALLEKRLRGGRAKAAQPARVIPPRPDGEPLPLSFSQRRLWFLQQLEPSSPTYHISNAFRLLGPLHHEALHKSLTEIVRRHEALRTTFAVEGDDPIQVIHAPRPISLPLIDLSHLSESEQTEEVSRLLNEEARQPFDLTGALLMRGALLRLREEEHVLLLTMHHIASDGWSLGVLVRELGTLYDGFVSGETVTLPDLPVQYGDFAHWQRGWLQGERLEKQLHYWREHLSGVAPLLELPTDRPRPAMQSFRGARQSLRLSPALTAQLKELARQENVTLFMVLLAAFNTLLYRYSRQDDIVVGSPIANRQQPEIEGLIGFFVNTLVLRSRLAPEMSVRELLAQVRETTLGAYAHQDLPFERLVEELKPERNLSYSPLFQVQFVLQNTPMSDLNLSGLTLEYLPMHRGTAKFDLTLFLLEDEAALTGALEYNLDLFDAATIERMAGHLQQLLEGMVADPQQRLGSLPLLTREERAQVVQRWNDTARPYSKERCLQQLFEEQAARTPQAVAVIFEGESLTYQELNRRANQVAHYLKARGVGPDVRVGLFADRSLTLMVGLLGILKAGGAYVPIDPIAPRDRIGYMAEDAGMSLMLSQAHLLGELPPLDIPVISLEGEAEIARQPEENPVSAGGADNLIYVLFTSGSTGRPKGVGVEHRQVLNYLFGILERAEFPAGASYAVVSTFAADLGNTVIFPAICTGGSLHIISYERAADPAALADYFANHRIDCVKIVPSHFEALQSVARPEQVIPHARLIFGGESSRWESIERIRALRPECVVMNHYGPTETTVGVLTYRVGQEPTEPRAAVLPLGRPLPNSRIYLLDPSFQPVPVGVPGEVYIGGEGVTRGYLNRPALTAERFIPDPFSPTPGARLYRTGDLARYLPDGNIEFLGRTDHQVKIRGYRIELGEIESLLLQHPVVREAVVIAREDTPGDKRLVAYVVPEATTLSISQLRTDLREQLPDYMVPGAFVPLEALPLTPNGKIDRRALPVPDQSRVEEATFTEPRTPLEKEIAATWSEVLGIDRVGIDDNFFDLGGESFKAIRVVRRLGEGISVMTLFKHPTVRELAAALSDESQSDAGDTLLHELTRPVPEGKRELTLVCVPYGGGSAITFQPLADALPSTHSLYALELPGHDMSRREEPLESLEEIAARVVQEIKQRIRGPLALYGHCVGGALTVEIARQLEQEGIALEKVYLAASFPNPRIPGKFFALYNKIFARDLLISDRSYHDFLKSLGGFTDVIEEEELAFVMRNLRHDFNEAEDYYTAAFASESPAKLQAPIVCLVGEKDRATEFYAERVRDWEHFSHSVRLAVVKGAGHFFLKNRATAIVEVLTSQPAVSAESPAQASQAPREKPVQPSLKAFSLVALGQLISMIGTGLTGFALALWVLQQTGSVSNYAFIAVFSLLPGILALPLAGALVDRWDRRWIMILADLASGTRTLGLIGLLATGNLELWHLYVAAGIGSICGAFQRPAYAAAIAQLVPKRYLGHANGIAQLGTAAGTSLAPLLGGALIGLVSLPGVLFVDFVSFLVAIGSLLLVRFPNTLFRMREEPLVQEILNGWRYIAARPGMVAMVLFFTTTNFLMAIMGVLIAPIALSFTSATTFGVMMAIGGAGMIVGSLVMGAWGGTRRRAEGMIGFVALEGLFMLLMGLSTSVPLFTLGLFGFYLCLALSNGHWQALIQTKVNSDLQGRVFSTNQMMAWSMMPLGYLLAGPLADHIFEPLLRQGGALAATMGLLIGTGPSRGMALMMIIAGVLTLIVGWLGYQYPRLRLMEDELEAPLFTDTFRAEAEIQSEVVLL